MTERERLLTRLALVLHNEAARRRIKQMFYNIFMNYMYRNHPYGRA